MKIDSLAIETYNMVLTRFLLQDNLEKIQFYKRTFLLTNISIEVVLKISFLFLNNIDIKFGKLKKLIWRSYTIVKALLTTS